MINKSKILRLFVIFLNLFGLLSFSNIYAGEEITWQYNKDTIELYYFNSSDPSVYSKDYYNKDKNGREFKFFKNGENLFLKATKDGNLLSGNVKNMSISSSNIVTKTNIVANDKIESKEYPDLDFVTAYTYKTKYGVMVPNNTVSNYGVKLGYRNKSTKEIEYKYIGDDILKYYAIKPNVADSKKPMINWNVMDNTYYEWMKQQVNLGNVPLINNKYTFYVSKIYATDITANSGYDYNFYKSGQKGSNGSTIDSIVSDDAYEAYMNFSPTFFNNYVNVTIIYKYKDTSKTNVFTENTAMEITLDEVSKGDNIGDFKKSGKSVLDKTLGLKTNYNYVGYKYITSDNDSIATLKGKIDSSSNSGGWNKSFSLSASKKNTVICLYYDTRPIKVNHYLTDKSGNEVVLNKDKKIVSGSNNIDLRGGADDDVTYKYFEAAYTYPANGKTYTYAEGEKVYASTFSVIDQTGGIYASWGSTPTQTKVTGSNYYGDGKEFKPASAVQINFYYQEKPPEQRTVFIRHFDQNGNLIGKNPTEKINGVDQPNGYNALSGKKVSIPDDVSEYFIIGYQDRMTISAYVNSNYDYIGYQIGSDNSKNSAKIKADAATRVSSQPVNLANSTINYTYVNLYYRPKGADGSYNQDIDFTGKLAFVNNPLDSGSSKYSSSTSSDDTDYIASGKALKGYISGAYPYYFRRADYEKNKRTGTKTATITISVRGYISGLTHGGCDSTHKAPDYGDPILDEEGNPTGEREIIGYHTTCQSYSRTITKTLTYTYNVPYEHTYYKIKNFKMYRISKVDLFDSTTNKGEVLFDQGETVYTLNTSSAYQSRLNGGFTDNITTVDLPSSSYSLSDESDRSCGTGGSDDCSSKTSRLESDLQARLNAVSASSAASHQNLTFTLTGTNDTFKLPNKPELFNTNKIIQTWSIRSLNEATKKIDTTVPNYPYNYTQYQTVGNATTNVSDFESNPILRIPLTQVNGMRVLKARIYYDIDTVLNRSNGLTSENIGVDNNNTQMHEYKDSEVNKVNVLTPLNISVDIATQQTVNHSDKNQVNLQKNATFTITPRVSTSSVASYNNVDTNEFIKYYYIRCDFDITNVVIYGNKTESEGYDTFTQNEILRSGTWVKVPAGGYITGKATQYTETEGETVDIAQNTIEAVGITKNIPFLLEDYIYSTLDANSRSTSVFSNYVDNNQIWQYTANTLRQSTYYTIRSIVADGFHMARATRATSNLGRIFDFKLTDCSDLNFKDVFRKSSGNNVNEPTGTVYFSGVKRLRIYDTSSDVGYNETESVSNTKTILPLGPYKNTNITQIDAPKLGYRIAFDLKTTGNISDDKIRAGTRKIVIKPSYYYIGKDGTGYDENITLYYKNAEGKYIPFVNSATPYKIYFKPNDGYRNLSNRSITPNNTFLSDKLEELEISSPNGFVLNYKMLDTSGMGDNFIQSWYGEFKLPNSTIAVQNGGNINSPKTGGYIGVRFNIECVDTINGQTITLSYNKNDSSASPNTNTTQWDYDGYLGFVNPGSEAKDLKLRLGSTTMTLDNNMYNKMKGTVILYDTDNRAAQDFE